MIKTILRSVLILGFLVNPRAFAQTSEYGAATSVVGDVDDDGFPELLVSDPAFRGSGRLYVFRGSSRAFPALPSHNAAVATIDSPSDAILRMGIAIKAGCQDATGKLTDVAVRALPAFPNSSSTSAVVFLTLADPPIAVVVLGSDEFVNHLWNNPNCDWSSTIVPLAPPSGSVVSGGSTSMHVFSILDVTNWSFSASNNMLDYYPNAIRVVSIARDAATRYGGGSDRDNALRHGYWQATLTREFGAAVATEIGDSHEFLSSNRNMTDSWIDQYNNRIGRRTGQRANDEGWSNERLIQELNALLADGTLIMSPCDDRVPDELKDCNGNEIPDSEECEEAGQHRSADVNGDGMIDMADVDQVIYDYDTTFCRSDIVVNGIVDSEDVSIVIRSVHL